MNLPLCAKPGSFLGIQKDVTYWGNFLVALKGHSVLDLRYPVLPAWTLLPVSRKFS